MPYGTVNADLMTTSDGVSSSGLYGFKNRIINGAMTINQRGSSITSNGYSLDRYLITAVSGSKMTVQQSSDAPTGFSNSLLITSSAATTIGSTDYYDIGQRIEGFNTYDLMFGTANAKTITISFWVKSSLTGTFGASLQNSAQNRSYPFTFTISTASTWTQISTTIAGDTSGTWVGATAGIGMQLLFNLGTGSSTLGTAGAWTAGYIFPTGEVNILATNGATLQITGVQLEKGSTATSFDYRPYGTELQLCQRYFEIMENASMQGSADSATLFIGVYRFLIEKRSAPTLTLLTSTPAISEITIADRTGSGSALGTNFIGTKSMRYQISGFSSMTARNPVIGNGTTTGIISLSSEL